MTNLADRRRLRAKFALLAAAILAPPPQITVSQWADQNRILTADAGAVEPGPWRTDRVPYLREIQDALGDPTLRRVVFMKSSQVGGTECGHNWLGYIVDQAPAPILALYPTDDAFKTWSTVKLEPLLRDTECLRRKVVDFGGRRDQRNTMSRKQFPGGFLVGLAARSSAKLRALAAPFAIAEEIDEYEPDVNRQGDPLELLERALRTFLRSGGKLYIVSTPTLAGFSRIEAEYERSDQRHYYVPCPHCGTMQRLAWLDADGRYRLVCDRGPDGELIAATARYLCVDCGSLIEERRRDWMLAPENGAEWRATHPERETRGYHINTLYSPFVAWADIVQKFLDSRRSPLLLKTFDNLWLGLPHEEKGEKIEPRGLAARAEPYGKIVSIPPKPSDRAWEIPRGVGVLTVGADVQGDRLEGFLWGWGKAEEAWVIEWGIFDGDPGQDEVWQEFDRWLLEPKLHEAGAKVRITSVAIDANYQTERVHRFCEARTSRSIIPTIGRQGRGKPLIQAPGPQKYKQAGARKVRPSYVIGVDSGKDMLASKLRVVEPGPHYVHFAETLDPVFYDQLTAEKLVTVYLNKIPVRRWVKIEGRANEALDGAVLAMAALAHLGPAVTAKLGELADRITAAGAQGPVPAPPPPVRRVRHRGLEG